MTKRTYVLICLAIIVLLNAFAWLTSGAQAAEPYPAVTLEYNSTECTYADGVTAQACSYPGITYLSSDYTAYSFRYEMSHQVDFLWMNNAERSWLMHNWRIGKHHWEDSSSALNAGNEDGGEGIFPMVYAYCWFHKTDVGKWFQFMPNAAVVADTNPVAKPVSNDCAAFHRWFSHEPNAV